MFGHPFNTPKLEALRVLLVKLLKMPGYIVGFEALFYIVDMFCQSDK